VGRWKLDPCWRSIREPGMVALDNVYTIPVLCMSITPCGMSRPSSYMQSHVAGPPAPVLHRSVASGVLALPGQFPPMQLVTLILVQVRETSGRAEHWKNGKQTGWLLCWPLRPACWPLECAARGFADRDAPPTNCDGRLCWRGAIEGNAGTGTFLSVPRCTSLTGTVP
jgi:hypothetical protein